MENKTAKIFFDGLSLLGLKLDAGQIGQFDSYLSELLFWNGKINLIGPAPAEEIITRHFLDSLSAASTLKEVLGPSLAASEGAAVDTIGHKMACGPRVADIGTGAGFPGLPLKIAMPEIQLTLIDSISKKTEFLRHICKKLDISAEIICERAEDVAKKSTNPASGGFDAVIARAVAKPEELKKLGFPLLNPGGFLVLHVSAKTLAELDGENIFAKTAVPEKILPGRAVIAIKKPA